MEAFEAEALDTAPLKPKFYKHFVDDTLIIWPHGLSALLIFMTFLNEHYKQIHFTMELEQNGTLPFLDILLFKQPDGTM